MLMYVLVAMKRYKGLASWLKGAERVQVDDLKDVKTDCKNTTFNPHTTGLFLLAARVA